MGRDILVAFAAYLLKQVTTANTEGKEVPAAVLSVIRSFLTDNAVTLAHIRRGDFGQVAATAADEFPFNDDGSLRGAPMMMGSKAAN